MGLKLRWFRARMSFGGAPKDKHNTVTGVGFKQTSEVLPTYKQINTEFTSPILTRPQPHGRTQNAAKREINSEVALKVRSMLDRSYSNAHTNAGISYPQATKSTENLSIQSPNSNNKIDENEKYNNRKSDSILEYEKRKAELLSDYSDSDSDESSQHTLKVAPKSILKSPPKEENSDDVFDTVEENVMPKRSVISNTSEYSEPPPVNYDTLPKKDKELMSKQWERIVSSTDDDFEDLAIPNEHSDPYDLDEAYVIEIQEGHGESEPISYTNQDKKKKSISFEDHVTEIKNGSEVKETLEDREQKRLSMSSGSELSEENHENDQTYGNDYANTKRTSYFQAGGTTFSSQAASIFFAGKKPVNERRPTKFVPRKVSEDSDTSA